MCVLVARGLGIRLELPGQRDQIIITMPHPNRNYSVNPGLRARARMPGPIWKVFSWLENKSILVVNYLLEHTSWNSFGRKTEQKIRPDRRIVIKRSTNFVELWFFFLVRGIRTASVNNCFN